MNILALLAIWICVAVAFKVTYKTPTLDKALVVTRGNEINVYRNTGCFVIPFFQRAKLVNLQPFAVKGHSGGDWMSIDWTIYLKPNDRDMHALKQVLDFFNLCSYPGAILLAENIMQTVVQDAVDGITEQDIVCYRNELTNRVREAARAELCNTGLDYCCMRIHAITTADKFV